MYENYKQDKRYFFNGVELRSKMRSKSDVEEIVEEVVIEEPSFTEDLFEEPPVTQTVLRVVEEVVTESIQVVEETPTEATAKVEVTEAESSQEEPEHEPAKPQVNSRWAEVLFGEKEEDEETF